MNVNIGKKAEFRVMCLHYGFFGSPYGRLGFRSWLLVISIEILILGVMPVVPSVYAVRVQNRYDLEYKLLSYHFCLLRRFINNEIEDAV